MKKLLTLAAFLITGLLAYTQTTFEKDYDGGGNDSDEARCMIASSDGGYVMAGASWLNDDVGYEMTIMKTDGDGNWQWTKTYGIGSMNIEVAYGVAETSDGGFIMTGGTDGFSGGDDTDMWVIRTDENGDSLWAKTYGGDGMDYGFSGMQTSDGGFIFAGSTTSFGAGGDDVYLVKTDDQGNEQWYKTFGTQMAEGAYHVTQTSDGGYIIAGAAANYMDFYIIKTDASGNEEWSQILGGGATEEAYWVIETEDGGYAVTGGTQSIGAGNYDVWLVILDEDGEVVWDKTYGGSAKDKGWSVFQTSDGGYFITGYSESYHHSEEDSDMYLIRTDAIGDTLWTKNYGYLGDDGGYCGIQTENGQFVATGYFHTLDQALNFYLVKTDEDGTVGMQNITAKENSMHVYPNPMRDRATIEFDNPNGESYDLYITDITGKTVRTIKNIQEKEIAINKGELSSGVYFIVLKGDETYRSKMVIK
jgi:hypothetical protein